MTDEQKQFIKVVQTIIIIAIAIPLGVVPLIQQIFGSDSTRLFNWVFREPTGSAEWIIPIAVIIVSAIVVIAVEELPKRQT